MKTIGDTCNTGNTTVLFLNKLVATLPWLLLTCHFVRFKNCKQNT